MQGFPQESGQWGGGKIQNCGHFWGGTAYTGGESGGDIFDMGGDIKNLQICK